jgi:hypothetical protein
VKAFSILTAVVLAVIGIGVGAIAVTASYLPSEFDCSSVQICAAVPGANGLVDRFLVPDDDSLHFVHGQVVLPWSPDAAGPGRWSMLMVFSSVGFARQRFLKWYMDAPVNRPDAPCYYVRPEKGTVIRSLVIRRIPACYIGFGSTAGLQLVFRSVAYLVIANGPSGGQPPLSWAVAEVAKAHWS